MQAIVKSKFIKVLNKGGRSFIVVALFFLNTIALIINILLYIYYSLKLFFNDRKDIS